MARTKNSAKKAVNAAKTTKPAPEVAPEVTAAPVANETLAPVAEEKPAEAANVAPAPVSKTVTVMYRNPTGLRFKVPDRNGEVHEVRINGYGEPLRGLEKGVLIPGWGMTHNVDAELWEAVEERYKRVHPAFTRGYIRAFKDAASAEDEANNRREMKSSLDPVEPDKTNTIEA